MKRDNCYQLKRGKCAVLYFSRRRFFGDNSRAVVAQRWKETSKLLE